MVELVAELEKLPQTATLAVILAEAKAGEYHDYKNQKYVCGKLVLVERLATEARRVGTSQEVCAQLMDLRRQVCAGEFDEEADEDDKAEMRKTMPQSAWGLFGL